jgi:hypothetical protein
LFPDNYFVFHADRVHINSSLTHGGGVLTAVHPSLSGCKCRYDLELTNEYVWIKIHILDGFCLLV